MSTGAEPSMEARIRAHALEVFRERGVDASPLREIADALGVTKAALYYHFPSKDDLLRRLVTPYLDDLGAVLLDHEGATSGEALPALLHDLMIVCLRNAGALHLTGDPAVRRMDRLATRIDALSGRAFDTILLAAGLTAADRPRAVAALAALHALTSLPAEELPTPAEVVALSAAPLDPHPGTG